MNQGAYLTLAPEDLVKILDDAYMKIANVTLTEIATGFEPVPEGPPAAQDINSMEELSDATNLSVEELKEIELLLKEKRQLIFEGPPGAGKTFVAEKFARYFTDNPLNEKTCNGRLRIVQFHQSYGYEDFIQGIRPETKEGGEGDGRLEYHVRPGIFKQFCDDARADRNQKYAIIIDEINRGNISRIFGELLFLLEYRDKEVSLAYAKPGDKPFSIPDNVFIVGTMNTADRSLAQIDYALRRRFYFYRLMPVVDGRAPVLENWLGRTNLEEDGRRKILNLFIKLNEHIQQYLGEHFQVGHSYFMLPDISKDEALKRVWRRAVLPLLDEYFHNSRDRGKILSEFSLDSLLQADNDPLTTTETV